MSLNIAILGASGHVGQATLEFLSKHHEANHNITAFVRDPDNIKNNIIKELPHINVKAGDLGNEAAITPLLHGIDVVFIILPGHIDCKAIGQAAIRASHTAGAKHIVLISGQTASQTHMKFAREFAPVEDLLTSHIGSAAYTIIRLPFFLENNFAHAGSIKANGVFYGPQDGEATFAALSVQDIGEASARILTNPTAHSGKIYNIVGDKLYTLNELAKEFSQVLEKDVQYIRVDYESAQKAITTALGEWYAECIVELYRHIDDKDPMLSQQNSDFELITGHTPHSLSHWVQSAAPAFK
eukprot:c3198_g1_i1.p1 GENE.c3198_g1_i1~~c3198_g1_i1.p1  ORF type:complete len:329 (-),score=106.79 c3198_g1_i1:199-1092(-)